jgi:hypothetical protein
MPKSGWRIAYNRRGVRSHAVRVALATAALVPISLISCGGGDSDVPDDERVRQITGVAELATNAYAAAGPEGLYDYLAKDIAEECSKEELAQALERQPIPEGFRGASNVLFDGAEATANVKQLFVDRERQVEWRFVLEDDSNWRLTHVPGLEACA